jgi:hypothetical protein
MLNQLKARARALKREAYAVDLAARDRRTPWYAKALVFFVVAHTFIFSYISQKEYNQPRRLL